MGARSPYAMIPGEENRARGLNKSPCPTHHGTLPWARETGEPPVSVHLSQPTITGLVCGVEMDLARAAPPQPAGCWDPPAVWVLWANTHLHFWIRSKALTPH